MMLLELCASAWNWFWDWNERVIADFSGALAKNNHPDHGVETPQSTSSGVTSSEFAREELFDLTRDDFIEIAASFGDSKTIARVRADPTYQPWICRSTE